MPKISDGVVSLFSGAGGCSLGFASAGLKPIIAADIDDDACATYSRNLDIEAEVTDLSQESAIARIVRRVGAASPFAVVGGPPCQGFSTAGPRNADDPRNRLIFNYLGLIERLQPRWFLFENVEGLLTSNAGNDIYRMARELGALGYSFRIEKVNFAGFGLPQTRKRVLILGNRLGHRFDMREPMFAFDSGKSKSCSNLPFAPSLLDAIADLPSPSSSDVKVDYDLTKKPTAYATSLLNEALTTTHHWAPSRTELSSIARHLKPGQTMKDLPPELQHDSYWRRANRRVRDGMPTEKRGGAPSGFKRLRGDLNALTITSAASREFIHPTEDRALTLRECARLQSFPDAFHFQGNFQSVARQIGNAIPPLAGRILAELILREDGRAGGSINLSHSSIEPGLIGFHLTDAGGMSPALSTTAAALQKLVGRPYDLPLFRVANG